MVPALGRSRKKEHSKKISLAKQRVHRRPSLKKGKIHLTCALIHKLRIKLNCGNGEMVQRLRVLAALPRNWVPTRQLTTICNSISRMMGLLTLRVGIAFAKYTHRQLLLL